MFDYVGMWGRRSILASGKPWDLGGVYLSSRFKTKIPPLLSTSCMILYNLDLAKHEGFPETTVSRLLQYSLARLPTLVFEHIAHLGR